MKYVFFFSFVFVMLAFSPGRFAKYDVGDSGCKLYLPTAPQPVTMSYSEDSSRVYTIECEDTLQGNTFHYGAIVVRLNNMDITGIEVELLISYLDYLKVSLSIKNSAGYGKGHTLSTHPSAKGIVDYWEDETGDEWKVMGWIAEQTLVVQFIYGPVEFPNYNISEMFFKGFRFPGDN